MGCIARLGCLVVLAVLAVAAWLTRERWLHHVTGSRPAAVVSEPTWEPLTPAAAERGRRAISALSRPGGPVFANLHANEVAAYVFQTAGHALPAMADSAEAAVIGDALFVRAVVPVRDLGAGALGPLGGLLNARERLSLGGSFRVVRPGLSEFQIREIRVRDFTVPRGAIPRIVQQLSGSSRPEGISADAVPVPTPPALADVRIGNRRVTLYKTTPP